jgi:hypothetical protein
MTASLTPRTKWTRRVPHPVLIGHAASLTPQVLEHDLSPDVVTALDALAAGAPPSPLERKGSNGRSNGSLAAAGSPGGAGQGSVAAWAAGYLARLLATGRSGANGPSANGSSANGSIGNGSSGNGSSGDARGSPGSEANRPGGHAARPAAEGLSPRGEAWSMRPPPPSY